MNYTLLIVDQHRTLHTPARDRKEALAIFGAELDLELKSRRCGGSDRFVSTRRMGDRPSLGQPDNTGLCYSVKRGLAVGVNDDCPIFCDGRCRDACSECRGLHGYGHCRAEAREKNIGRRRGSDFDKRTARISSTRSVSGNAQALRNNDVGS